MSTNPFGEAPPTKPARASRPPPTNPFGGPTRQPSHDASKAGAKNPFAQTSSTLSVSVPSSTPSSNALTPVVPTSAPPVPSPTPPSLPPVLEAVEAHELPPPIPHLPPSTPTTAPPLPPPPLPPMAPPEEPHTPPHVAPLPPIAPIVPIAEPETPPHTAPLPPFAPAVPIAEPETPPHTAPLPPFAPAVPIAEPETPPHTAPLPPPAPVIPPVEDHIHNDDDGFGFDVSHVTSDPFATSAVASHDFASTIPASHFDDDGFNMSFPTPQKTANIEEPSIPSVPPTEQIPQSSDDKFAEDTNIHVLAPPPPQMDDDPYEIHINKPLPTAPPVSTAPARPVKHEETKPKPAHKDGDPFSELVEPLKPKHVNPFAPKPVNPVDSMSLNALMAAKTQQKPPVVDVKNLVIPTIPGSSTAAVKETVVASTKPDTAVPKASVSAADPFAAPHANDKDFDLVHTTPAPVPAPAPAPAPAPVVPVVTPVITAADFDVFATKPKPVAVAATPAASVPFDPFASSGPAVAATAVVSDDTFDVFGVPQPAANTSKAKVTGKSALSSPPPPAITNKTATHNSQKPLVPPLQTSHPHDHLPTKQATTPSATGAAAPPLPDFIFSPAEYRKSNSHSFDHTHLHDDDPFGVPVKSVSQTAAGDDEDDFFETSTSSQSNAHFDQQDPLARLKQSYGLSSNLHDQDHNFDDFDDFTFDQANHGNRGGDFSKPGKQPTGAFRSSGKSSNASSSSDILRDTNSNRDTEENGVVAQGDILSRLSTKAMFTKDWHDTYYVIMRDQLYVFRQRADYFQFQAQLQNRRERRGSTGEGQAPLYKKCFPLQYNIKLEPIKGKEYKGLGVVYNFSLEQLEDFGLQHLGKFGSTDRDAVQRLWDKIRVIVMEKRKERLLPKPQYG